MALELSGSRVLAPYLGTSSFVWTSLIGIVLAALSVGYTLGGRLIDKFPNTQFYSRIILIAGLLTASVTLLQYPVLIALTRYVSDLRLASVLASLLLFGAPSVALGMILPSAVRLRIEDVENSGKSVGRLYAISTIGSIVGTFAAGFFLLALIGTNMMFLLIGLTLIITSILVDHTSMLPIKALSLVAVLIAAFIAEDLRVQVAARGMIDLDTKYQRVFVLDSETAATKRAVRYLVTDPLGSQSAMYIAQPDELVGSYSRFFHMIEHYAPEAKDILLLGGGAFSLPKSMLKEDKELRLDVVELDPGITEIAKDYFHLDPSSYQNRLQIYNEDARTFLNRNKKRYDALFLDVFGSSPTVPFHLTTREAVGRMREALKPDGVLIANVITAIEGDAGRYLRAQIKTLKEFFPRVELFPVSEPENAFRVQNIILVAFLANSKTPTTKPTTTELATLLEHRWTKKLSDDVPILLDDFAPVEFYMLPALIAMRQQNASSKMLPEETLSLTPLRP